MTGYLDQAHKITDDPSPLLEEVYGSVFSIMNQIDNKSVDKDVYTPKDMAERGFLDAKKRFQDPDAHTGLKTGISTLDEHIKSLKDLNVIAASTGVGKTGLALNIALNLALKKVGVLYINLEMNIDQMLCRILSNLSGVPVDEIETGKYEDNASFAKVAAIAKKLEMSSLYMTHNEPKNINKIISIINKYYNRYDIQVVIIDYIGHIEPDKLSYKENNRRISLGRYNQAIKNVCTKLDIKGIVVAQLNREGDKDPDLVNVGECWQLAQDADIFMILHFEMIKNSDPSGPAEFEQYYIKLAKNRNGAAPKTINVNYNKATQTITETDNGLRKGSVKDVRFKGTQTFTSSSSLFDG
jgi:replicative DNA helicase